MHRHTHQYFIIQLLDFIMRLKRLFVGLRPPGFGIILIWCLSQDWRLCSWLDLLLEWRISGLVVLFFFFKQLSKWHGFGVFSSDGISSVVMGVMFNSFIKYPWSLASELNLSQVWWQRNQDVDRKNTGFKEKARQNLPVWLGRTQTYNQSPAPTLPWPLPVTYRQSKQTTGAGTFPAGLNLSQALF